MSLNNQFQDEKFIGYDMPKWSPQINHLAYANEMLLFRSVDKYSVIQMIKVISGYEKVSGKMLNK